MAGKFTRFSEKRDVVISDITTYDDAVDGIEPDESSGLHIPLPENNIGFQLIQKMGWKSGHGLGRTHQGRVDPVPLKLKDDHMGLGRYEHEIDLAVEATEKRKQMEIEKEITPGLIDKYKNQMDKEKTIAESTSDLRQSYHCDLCDKQYTRYSEYDNHLNSYDHHHRQRLKNLKEYEVGRKFGTHKATIDPKRMEAAQMIALERAEMKAQRQSSGSGEPGFKPMGYKHSKSIMRETHPTAPPSDSTSNAAILAALRKRSNEEIVESEKKIAEKKARLEKYGVKFQSAGHLATINDNESDLSSYQTMILSGSERELTVEQQETKKDRTSNIAGAMYAGRFVSSGQSSGNEHSTNEQARNKRLLALPHAKGRKTEQLTAIEQTTCTPSNSKEGVVNEDKDHGDTEDDGFVFGRQKVLPFSKPKKLPVKQMSLKLSNKYESYYH